ncbi:hypothetical protein K503DRAFT_786266 [Rhizopogon vinicolor AM-OR11-026]|uniref:Uncharacterized protein n=1 Tax=Rhizopogon vinicolor AM-OR11-026 TaxID=1314800 RepID=A0A1B7MMF3_9AGAM|nr:hypothetical protein K503DRAFT_786266 [Rhizopogon vinicolor AM-OR11-026]
MFIGCWPLDTKFPGPNFSFKELKNRELRIIVGPYLKRKLGVMYDDERAEGKEEEREEFEILPWQKVELLVASSDGFSLQELGDFEEWKKVYQLAVEEKDAADASRVRMASGPSCSPNRTVAPILIRPSSRATADTTPPIAPHPIAHSHKTPAPTVACPPSCTTNTVAAPSIAPGPVVRPRPRKVGGQVSWQAATERDDLGHPEALAPAITFAVSVLALTFAACATSPSSRWEPGSPSRLQTRLPIGSQPRLPSGSRPRPPVPTAQGLHGQSAFDTIEEDYDLADTVAVDACKDVERSLRIRQRMGLGEQSVLDSRQDEHGMGDREVVVDDPVNISTILVPTHLPSICLRMEAVGRHHIISQFAMLRQLSTKLHSQLAGSLVLSIHMLITMSSLMQHSVRMNTMMKT